MTTPNRAPEKRFQAGGVSAAVFVNEAKRADGSVFMARKTVLQRTYVDGEGNYQSTSSLDVNDLPRAILVLQQAFEHCSGLRTGSETTDDGGADG